MMPCEPGASGRASERAKMEAGHTVGLVEQRRVRCTRRGRCAELLEQQYIERVHDPRVAGQRLGHA